MKVKEKIKKVLVDYTMKQFPEEFFKEPIIEHHDAKVKTFMEEQRIPLSSIPKSELDEFEVYMKKNLANMIAESVIPYMEFITREETEYKFHCRIYEARLKVVTGEDVWRTCKMR